MEKSFFVCPKACSCACIPLKFSFLSVGQSSRMACAACGFSGCRRILFGAVEGF